MLKSPGWQENRQAVYFEKKAVQTERLLTTTQDAHQKPARSSSVQPASAYSADQRYIAVALVASLDEKKKNGKKGGKTTQKSHFHVITRCSRSLFSLDPETERSFEMDHFPGTLLFFTRREEREGNSGNTKHM